MTEETERLTPVELLQTAERLFDQGDPNMYRAAILEAITALEAHVFARAFPVMRAKLDEELTDWLEEKTRMDFDTRIGLFLPLATGLKVNKKDKIWQDYKKAKDIRNKVTHSGKKVTRQQARDVINTVYEWMEYINQAQEAQVPKEDRSGKQVDALGRFLQANARLERVIYAAVQKNNPGGEVPRRKVYPVDELRRLDLVDMQEMQELHHLRSLRNRVVHMEPGAEVEITEEPILRLNELVDCVEERLRQSGA